MFVNASMHGLSINNYFNVLQNKTCMTTLYPCIVATDHAISIYVKSCWLCNCTIFSNAI